MTFELTTRAIKISLAGVAGAALVGGGLAQTAISSTPTSASDPIGSWSESWGAAMQRPTPGTEDNGPNWSMKGFADQSVRQVIRLSGGGDRVRIRLSNVYGIKPLKIAGAAVGTSAGGAKVWPGTTKTLKFHGAASTVVKPGAELASDPVALPTRPLQKLAVTLRFTEPTGPATFHRFTTQEAYRASGDHLTEPVSAAYAESTNSWYYLTGVDVAGGTGTQGTVVTFGDSLIDGVGSTGDERMADGLAERLAAQGRPTTVINAGIGGNRILSDTSCYGDKAPTRFRRDVLDRPGVRSVIIHLGANDIAAAKIEDPCLPKGGTLPTARRLIEGHRALIRAAHARGIKAIGATILPLKGALFPIWSPEAEKVRDEVNHWIRTSGEYDAVLDVDRVMADRTDPDRPWLGYVFEDGLHPNDAGYQAIVRAVPLGAL
ncbi:SGNH/GDSL hydrolase family protein [Actinoallomurus sp. NPDC052274]|uniref:SGNH/GDSL hydrolase family protein n=1 Tax=Actinoallomurus sp. NPDC052274 TaxID=3155420 RepID=UPI00341AD5CF